MKSPNPVLWALGATLLMVGVALAATPALGPAWLPLAAAGASVAVFGGAFVQSVRRPRSPVLVERVTAPADENLPTFVRVEPTDVMIVWPGDAAKRVAASQKPAAVQPMAATPVVTPFAKPAPVAVAAQDVVEAAPAPPVLAIDDLVDDALAEHSAPVRSARPPRPRRRAKRRTHQPVAVPSRTRRGRVRAR